MVFFQGLFEGFLVISYTFGLILVLVLWVFFGIGLSPSPCDVLCFLFVILVDFL